mgnify:FL=1
MREITVYAFAELSDEAKERALNEFRGINVEHDWWDGAYDTICTAGKLLGLDIDDISFDVYLYCVFDADYEYVCGAVKAIQAEFPRDTELHGVARKLQDLQKRHFYSLSCAVKEEGRSMNYYRCFRFGEDYECDLGDIIDDFAHWARILLRDEYEYLTSDEAVKEAIEANEYEFTEDGKLV